MIAEFLEVIRDSLFFGDNKKSVESYVFARFADKKCGQSWISDFSGRKKRPLFHQPR